MLRIAYRIARWLAGRQGKPRFLASFAESKRSALRRLQEALSASRITFERVLVCDAFTPRRILRRLRRAIRIARCRDALSAHTVRQADFAQKLLAISSFLTGVTPSRPRARRRMS